MVKSVLKSVDFKKEIMKNILKTKVVTTSEIAGELGVSWNTAEKHLLELTIEGKINRMKKAGVNLWVIK
ncbi:FaeA/PapI family transcriptional regulator [Nanoarchaeota archaeon]